MVNQNLKNTYEVEFLLSFTCEDKKDVPPYRGSSTVDLNGDDKQNEQLKKELAEVLRRHIAAINEFPEEIVRLEVLSFGKKDK